MKTAFGILLTVALAGSLGCASAPPGGPRSAFDLLRQREAATNWDPSTLLRADLDQDGAEDFAVGGTRGDLYVVGIVQGPAGPASRHWTLEIPMTGGTDEALCSRDVQISLEETEPDGPEGTGRPGVGISIKDDLCDAFHIYWDAEAKAYDWWRL